MAELYMDLEGRTPDPGAIRESLSGIYVRGRFEILKNDPMVIADASHNPEGTEKFCRTAGEYFPGRKKTIIFAVLSDKDYKSMIRKIIGTADRLILTTSGDSRSLALQELEKEVLAAVNRCKDAGLPREILVMDTVENSLNYALKISGTNDIICITGSITNLEHVYKVF